MRKNHDGIQSRPVPVCFLNNSVKNLVYLLTVNFGVGGKYFGSVEMFAKYWFSVSASTGYSASTFFDLPVICTTAFHNSLLPRLTSDGDNLAALNATILRWIWVVRASAASSLPPCIKRFFCLSMALICGVTNVGSQFDTVIVFFLAYIYFAVFSTTEVVSVYVVVSSLLTYRA